MRKVEAGEAEQQPRMSVPRVAAVLVAALAAGALVVALELKSDHRDANAVCAVFAPVVGLSFVVNGL